MKYSSIAALAIVAGMLPAFAEDTVPYAYRPPTAGDTYVPTLGDIKRVYLNCAISSFRTQAS